MERNIGTAAGRGVRIDGAALERRLEGLTRGLHWPVAGLDCSWAVEESIDPMSPELGEDEGIDVCEHPDGTVETWPELTVELLAALLGVELADDGEWEFDADEDGGEL